MVDDYKFKLGLAIAREEELKKKLDALTAHDEAKERELFEVKIRRIAVENDYQFLSFLFPRDETGKYRTAWVDMAWLGWSECAKSRARSAE